MRRGGELVRFVHRFWRDGLFLGDLIDDAVLVIRRSFTILSAADRDLIGEWEAQDLTVCLSYGKSFNIFAFIIYCTRYFWQQEANWLLVGWCRCE